MRFGVSLFLSSLLPAIAAFDNTRYDNVAVYWGQNSHGASDAADTANYQKSVDYYCQDDAIDIIPVAFINKFSSTGGVPELNLANICGNTVNATFPGTAMPDCSALAPNIKACQAKGKALTLSLGGGGASVGFNSNSDAETFADFIWNSFLGGTSNIRPLGDAVLDGVDLDIESGSSTGYVAFVNKIRSYAAGAEKPYYITGAPQCVYPDASLGSVINAVGFDAVYVQFYNNQCGLQNYNVISDWDFGIWDYWARNVSPNPNVKVYLGAPAASGAAGGGYVGISTLNNIATTMRNSYPSFGGVMLWDASQAYANGRYDLGIKNALVAAGGTGFTYPSCSAPAYTSGSVYTAGSKASYNGYIWEAKWWTQSTPTHSYSGDWTEISACQGGSTTTTSTSSQSSPTGVNCASVSAWSSTTVYTAGQQATYNGHLYTAKWWTEGDIPTGPSGAWADAGACTSGTTKRSPSSKNGNLREEWAKSSPEKKRYSRFFSFK